MPSGEFYIEGKKEKTTLAVIEAKLDKLLVLQRSLSRTMALADKAVVSPTSSRNTGSKSPVANPSK